MVSLQEKIAGAILSVIRKRRTAPASLPADSHAHSAPAHSSKPLPTAKVREVQFSDFEAVARLKQRWRLNVDSLENWERLWRLNPALMKSAIARPLGWVLEADGAVVGYLGNISLQCRYGERTLTAVTAHGLVVDTPYRAVSLTLAAAFFRQKNVDLYFATTAIEAVGKMALAFKSAPLPQPDYDAVLFWVLQPYPFARDLMTKLNFGPAPAWLGSALSAVAVGTDKVLRRRWPKQTPTSFTIREIAPKDIGDDFQSLWTAKLDEGVRLFADRSPAALRWHLEIPGDRGCARVLCCHKDGKLVGYAVLRIDTDADSGLKKSIIADTLVRQDDPEVVKALWAAAYDCAKLAGSYVLEVMGFPPAIRGACSEWNPYVRTYPACPYYYKAADPVLHKLLSDGQAWYATPFDGDATLIRHSYASSVLQGGFAAQMEGRRANIVSPVPIEERTEVF